MKTKRLVLIPLSGLMLVTACRSAVDNRADVEVDGYSNLTAEQFTEMLERYATKQADFLECDGYLTALESEGFCSTDVPREWVPFEYDGSTYFVQPLARQRH